MNPDTMVGDTAFVEFNQVRSSREIQLGAKVLW